MSSTPSVRHPSAAVGVRLSIAARLVQLGVDVLIVAPDFVALADAGGKERFRMRDGVPVGIGFEILRSKDAVAMVDEMRTVRCHGT